MNFADTLTLEEVKKELGIKPFLRNITLPNRDITAHEYRELLRRKKTLSAIQVLPNDHTDEHPAHVDYKVDFHIEITVYDHAWYMDLFPVPFRTPNVAKFTIYSDAGISHGESILKILDAWRREMIRNLNFDEKYSNVYTILTKHFKEEMDAENN